MKKSILVVLAGLMLFGLTSCVSTSGDKPGKVKKAVTSGEYPSPENSTLFFAYNTSVNYYLQQNPEIGYKFVYPNIYDDGKTILFIYVPNCLKFLNPLPVGAELKKYTQTYVSGRTIITEYFGIAGVDYVLNKPGLFYCDDTDPNNKHELKALKLLYKYFKGTDSEWEHLILDRMEELKNGK